ncbi:MAG: hypothetical protein ACI31G_03865 [Bacilli bacterium]
MENNNLFIIENDFIKLTISSLGAEIVSLTYKTTNKEKIFEGDDIWKGHFHNIFPLAGRNKDDIYVYQNKKYQLNLHGFAKDKTFTLVKHTKDFISFNLKDDKNTLLHYPFHFLLTISYLLKDNSVIIEYKIKNLSETKMYYSIGLHPGFKLDITDDNQLKNYKILLSNNSYKKLLTNEQRLIKDEIIVNNNCIDIDINQFNNGGLLYQVDSDNIDLIDESNKKIISLKLDKLDFPYLVLYSHKNGHFICIEPWSGITSLENESKNLIDKRNIFQLDVNEEAYKSITLEVN